MDWLLFPLAVLWPLYIVGLPVAVIEVAERGGDLASAPFCSV
jgi:hypothetical protein